MSPALSAAVLSVLAASGGVRWLGPPLKGPAQRVVTLAPSLTQSVVALERTKTLVGVSRFDELDEVKALPRVGGFSDVSVEAVVAAKPQLVVVQMAPGNQKPVERLAALGHPVLAVRLTSVEDVKASLLALGRALGAQAEAKRLVKDIDDARTAARAAAKQRGRSPRVLLAYGFNPLVVAGPGSFAHELLEDCGATNLAQAAPTAYPVYSVEKVVALEPDLLIDASDGMAAPGGWTSLPELKALRIVKLPTKELLHPGPALPQGLAALSALLAEGLAGDGGAGSDDGGAR